MSDLSKRHQMAVREEPPEEKDADGMEGKEARQLAQGRSMPCPCCGSPLVVKFDVPEHGARHYQALVDTGAQAGIYSVEQIEEELRLGSVTRFEPKTS